MNNGFYCGKGKVLSCSVVMDGAGPVLGSSQRTSGSKWATVLNQLCAAATADARPSGDISAKLDRVLKLTRDVVTQRTASIPSMPGVPSLAEMASRSGPSAGQLAAQWQAAYEVKAARKCAESEAVYAARNPHKKGRK